MSGITPFAMHPILPRNRRLILLTILTLVMFTGPGRMLAQSCNSVPVGPDEFNLPSYYKASQTSMAEDTAGNLYVASLDPENQNRPVVHKYNGTTWEKLGTSTLTNCSRIDLAVSDAGIPYVALRDPNQKLSVLSYSAGSWNYVGSAGFSSVTVYSMDMQIDKQQNPVVFFQDQTNTSGSIMKYSGGSWSFVGSQYVSSNYIDYLSLAIDTGNVYYVGYQDGSTYPGKATVRKLAGTTWTLVGAQYFSTYEAAYISLKFDRNNKLYAAYSDYYNNQKVTVKSLNSGTWTTVGSVGFTAGGSTEISLAIDTNGVPSVAANVNNGTVNRGNVMQYVNSTWTNVGNWDISEKEATSPSHIVTRDNKLAVAYVDQNRQYKAAVKIFNGSTWDFIGDRGFSGGVAVNSGVHFAVGPTGDVFTCFTDSINNNKASVMKWTNGAWGYVGSAGITPSAAPYVRIAVDGSNVPYIAYSDYSNGMKLAVMKYNGSSWQNVGTPPLTSTVINACDIAVVNGTPYVIATNTTGSFVDVIKFNGSSWSSINNLGSNLYNRSPRLLSDNSGNLYVNTVYSSLQYLSRYNGSVWSTTAIVLPYGNYPDITLDPISQKIYAGYSASTSFSLALKRWDSPSPLWQDLGGNTTTTYTSYGNSMVTLNGVVYLAFIDGNASRKARVMRFDGNNWADVASIPWVSGGRASDLTLQAKGNDTLLLLYRSTETYMRKIALGSISVNTVVPGCGGTSATLTASGASSYTWNIGPTVSSIVVSPTITTGYVVSSTLSSGCIASACRVVSVIPTPTVSITSSPSSGTLCIGDFANVTANGANTYTWSTGSTNTTLILQVQSNTLLTVTGTGTLNSCTNTAAITLSAIPYPTITIATSQTSVCPGDQVVLTPSGAPNYNLVNTNTSGTGAFTVNPLATTVYTIDGNNGCAGTETISIVVNPSSGPFITPSSPSVCAGSQLTLSLFGASSYTWNGLTPPSSSTVMIVSPTITPGTTYSAQVTNTYGCPGNASVSINVVSLPVVTAVQSASSICAGDGVTFSGQGASTYTWTQGVLNNVSFTPAVSSVYTVTGASTAGCINTATLSLTVLPLPTVTASSSSTAICVGGSATLSATGATTYSWSTGATVANTAVSPSSTSCYTITGTDLNGCIDTGVVCVQVMSTNLSVSSASVCKGTSYTFSVSGAQSYTWSNASNGSTLNVLPLLSTSYSVSGTGSNGCIGNTSFTLDVDSTCSDVWPGDANSDGVVNSSDVFELGWAASATGAARQSASNTYIAQHASNWTGTVSTGKNLCHADCNGDGLVSQADTLAITNNFSQTHSFRVSGAGAELLHLVVDPVIGTGVWRSIDVVLGDSLNQVTTYGLGFDLDYSGDLIESAFLEYPSSFLNAGDQNVEFRKNTAGLIYAVSVRTDKNDISGYGLIARLHFILKDEAVGQQLQFSVSNGKLVKANHDIELIQSTQASAEVVFDQVGLAEHAPLMLKVVPNPANQELKLLSSYKGITSYVIYDVTGRLVKSGDFDSSSVLMVDTFAPGLYFVEITNGGHSALEKMVIMH